MVIWTLLLGHGSIPFAGGFLLVMSVSIVLTSIYEILQKKRRKGESDEERELPSSLSTKELPEARETPSLSVTESTTRDLKARARREDTLH